MTGTSPGPQNLITDVSGINMGHAQDERVRTGVTVILPETRAVMGGDVRGGGPGTRETDALDPACLVDEMDAVVLSGGSVYGLDAASGVVAALGAKGRGFALPSSPLVALLYRALFCLISPMAVTRPGGRCRPTATSGLGL